MTDGYADAFYEIAEMLGIEAQTRSPAEVWASEMRPALIARLALNKPFDSREFSKAYVARRFPSPKS